MFCPECRTEYRKGFTRCGDCDVTLVDNLPAFMPYRQVDNDEPAIVFATANANEAALVKSLLEASGVETYLLDEHLSRIDSPIAILIGGVKIAVPRQEEELALAVLTEFRGRAGQDPTRGQATPIVTSSEYEPFDQEFPAGVDEFRCPHCRALLEPETTACGNCGREPW